MQRDDFLILTQRNANFIHGVIHKDSQIEINLRALKTVEIP